MVLPDSWIETGAPVAFGATARTAATKRRKVVVVVGVALGRDLDPGAPVRGAPSRSTISGGRLAGVTGSACSAWRSCAEHVASRPGHERRRGAVARSLGRRLGERGERSREPPRRRRARVPARRSPPLAGAAADSSCARPSPRRSAAARRLERDRARGSSSLAASAISASFGVLILRHEARKRRAPASTSGSSPSLLRERCRPSPAKGAAMSIVFGVSFGSLHQVEEGRDRFDLAAAQVQRIEVEAQTRQERQAAERDQASGHDERRACDAAPGTGRPARGTQSRSAPARRAAAAASSSAGSRVTLVRNAISMPVPAISPELGHAAIVGRQEGDRKPAAIEAAASASGLPTLRAASRPARVQIVRSWRSAR